MSIGQHPSDISHVLTLKVDFRVYRDPFGERLHAIDSNPEIDVSVSVNKHCIKPHAEEALDGLFLFAALLDFRVQLSNAALVNSTTAFLFLAFRLTKRFSSSFGGFAAHFTQSCHYSKSSNSGGVSERPVVG